MEGTAKRAATLCLVLGCAGCYSPATHVGARTAPAGETETFGGVEVMHLRYPSLVVGLRHGLAERVDFGMRLSPDLRADAKLNAIRTSLLDVSFAPAAWLGYQYYLATVWESPVPPVGTSATALVDLHPSDAVSIGVHGGGGYMLFRTLSFGTDDPPRTEHGPTAHAGLGVSIRLTDDLIVRPEGTLWWLSPQEGDDWIAANVGITFVRGRRLFSETDQP